METNGKALKLLVFRMEGQTPETILSDTLYYNPGYRAGDIMHLVRPPAPADRQFVVLSARHVIVTTDTPAGANEHSLLIEVTELMEAERDDWRLPGHFFAT